MYFVLNVTTSLKKPRKDSKIGDFWDEDGTTRNIWDTGAKRLTGWNLPGALQVLRIFDVEIPDSAEYLRISMDFYRIVYIGYEG